MKSLTPILLNPNIYYGVFLFCLGIYFGKQRSDKPLNDPEGGFDFDDTTQDPDDTQDPDELQDTEDTENCVHIGSWSIRENYIGNLIFMKNNKILREILY